MARLRNASGGSIPGLQGEVVHTPALVRAVLRAATESDASTVSELVPGEPRAVELRVSPSHHDGAVPPGDGMRPLVDFVCTDRLQERVASLEDLLITAIDVEQP